MRKLSLFVTAGLLAWLAVGLETSTSTAVAAEPAAWGTIKGQVIWDGGAVPERKPLLLVQDKALCEEQGKKLGKELTTENYVIDPKSKGVKWVVVWLVDANDVTAKLPIHPALVKPKDAKVLMDQPCCMFEPHIICLREGQILEAKNSAPMPHNYKVDSPAGNPTLNQLIPPGKTLDIEGWKALAFPSTVSCTIHPWMKGYVRVFAHPYFAVTKEDGSFEIKNAPAGKWNVVMWQEETGYFLGQRDKKGVAIEIKAGATTDLGQYKLKPE